MPQDIIETRLQKVNNPLYPLNKDDLKESVEALSYPSLDFSDPENPEYRTQNPTPINLSLFLMRLKRLEGRTEKHSTCTKFPCEHPQHAKSLLEQFCENYWHMQEITLPQKNQLLLSKCYPEIGEPITLYQNALLENYKMASEYFLHLQRVYLDTTETFSHQVQTFKQHYPNAINSEQYQQAVNSLKRSHRNLLNVQDIYTQTNYTWWTQFNQNVHNTAALNNKLLETKIEAQHQRSSHEAFILNHVLSSILNHLEYLTSPGFQISEQDFNVVILPILKTLLNHQNLRFPNSERLRENNLFQAFFTIDDTSLNFKQLAVKQLIQLSNYSPILRTPTHYTAQAMPNKIQDPYYYGGKGSYNLLGREQISPPLSPIFAMPERRMPDQLSGAVSLLTEHPATAFAEVTGYQATEIPFDEENLPSSSITIPDYHTAPLRNYFLTATSVTTASNALFIMPEETWPQTNTNIGTTAFMPEERNETNFIVTMEGEENHFMPDMIETAPSTAGINEDDFYYNPDETPEEREQIELLADHALYGAPSMPANTFLPAAATHLSPSVGYSASMNMGAMSNSRQCTSNPSDSLTGSKRPIDAVKNPTVPKHNKRHKL